MNGPPTFTDREKAKQAGLRSGELRRQRAKLRKLLPTLTAQQPAQTDVYASKRLLRIRRQLDSIDSMIDHETDELKLNRLILMSTRLSAIEQTLSCRPREGSLRPTRSRGPVYNTPIPEPVELAQTPQPVVNSGSQLNVTEPANTPPVQGNDSK